MKYRIVSVHNNSTVPVFQVEKKRKWWFGWRTEGEYKIISEIHWPYFAFVSYEFNTPEDAENYIQEKLGAYKYYKTMKFLKKQKTVLKTIKS